jgi:hypothetical protein
MPFRVAALSAVTMGGVGIAAAWVGCDSDVSGACTLEIRPGIVLEIRESTTGIPAACGATVTVRDDEFKEIQTLEPCDPLNPPVPDRLFALQMRFARERPGEYDIEIQKQGFRSWRLEDVRVAAGQCHVQTVTVRAFLEPVQVGPDLIELSSLRGFSGE